MSYTVFFTIIYAVFYKVKYTIEPDTPFCFKFVANLSRIGQDEQYYCRYRHKMLSVVYHLFVTRVYCDKTAQARIM